MLKIWTKNTGKNVSDKYSQKLTDHAKQSATVALKTTSKIVIQKTAEATGDLNGNKMADKITKVSRTSSQNSSKVVRNKTKKIWNLIKKYLKKDIRLQKKDRNYWLSKMNIRI